MNFKKRLQALKRQCLHPLRRPSSDSNLVENSILLASSGRSGSTWISEVLVENGKLRFLFEPLHPQWVKEFAEFPPRISLNPDQPEAKGSEAISNILNGKIDNPWVDQHNKFKNSQGRLIKCIRANLLLP